MARVAIIILLTLTCGLLPVAGLVRVFHLVFWADVTALNARFVADPLPVVLHLLAAALFGPLGAMQVWKALAGKTGKRHRALGRLLLPAGFIAALTGLWMTLAYPAGPLDGPLLYWVRLIVGTASTVALMISIRALAERDYRRHAAWILRGWALGMGAGMQALIGIPWTMLAGEPRDFERTALLTLGWVVNALIAEWVIHANRRTRPLARRQWRQT